ncbi:hypothetical protein FALBO_1372 [Fusarium albosuccineum]|uniref:Uncharacterized protein n=1 Tax=Fusarium albosuccineum TaxID=1237068 RepID=A0A8H4LLD2_9HYPO|nr:hypothetical protein FALBO_1372 [Fusarium albosuccineum]
MTSETNDRVYRIGKKLFPKHGFMLLLDRQDMFTNMASYLLSDVAHLANIAQDAENTLAIQNRALKRPSPEEFEKYKADYIAEGGREDDLPEGKVFKGW